MTSGTPETGETPRLPTPFPAVQSVLILLAVGGLALLVVSAMLVSLGRGEQWPTAAASGAVCLLAAVVAMEPVRRGSRVSLERVVVSAMATMGIRLAVSAVGVALLVWLTPLPTRPTALWALGWYLLLLLVEVVILSRYFRKM